LKHSFLVGGSMRRRAMPPGAAYINQFKRRNPWMNRTHIDKIMQWQQ